MKNDKVHTGYFRSLLLQVFLEGGMSLSDCTLDGCKFPSLFLDPHGVVRSVVMFRVLVLVFGDRYVVEVASDFVVELGCRLLRQGSRQAIL